MKTTRGFDMRCKTRAFSLGIKAHTPNEFSHFLLAVERMNYQLVLEAMIRESKDNGKYLETEDNTQKYLKTFSSVLTRTFKSSPLPMQDRQNNPGKIRKEILNSVQ